MTFKSITLASLAAAAVLSFAPATAMADDGVAFNAGLVTDYRYRGISQSRLKPALQGGIDYTAGPFYLGAWGSTIKWLKDFAADASVEIDVYGGYKGEISKELTYDVGFLTYIYPSNSLSPNANTTEVYGALSYGPVTAKYSHSLTNTFGNADSKNSNYLDITATFEVADGWTLAPHIGRQRISGPSAGVGTYTDVSVTLSKDFKGVVPSLALVSTDADKSFYSSPVNGKFLGKTALVLGVKVNF